MDLMGPFDYSQTVRWCKNIGFGNAFHTFALLLDICQQHQPWISMMQYFIEHKRLVHGKTKIRASW